MTDLECPDCGGEMVSRRNAQTGQRFYGCKNYPTCRGTRDTDGESPREHKRANGETFPSDRWRRADRSRWRA